MTILLDNAWSTVYYDDCLNVLKELPEKLTTLILTDPPYTKEEYKIAYGVLAAEAPRIMKPNSHLVMMVGQFLISNVCKIFEGKLRYNWIVWMSTPKKHIRMRTGVEVTGMPNLWFNKSNFSSHVQITDGFIAEGDDAIRKPLHKWQKDLSWADHFILALTRPGDVVLDPFAGSGTVLESAFRHKRIGIGIDVDRDCCDIMVRRLEGL